MQKIMNRDEGFTGLEAAIVLIAFVVVAAVFSYVVLGAGFFTTQKSQEVVYTSVEMASSNLEVIGDVYGLNGTSTDATKVKYIRFTVGLSAGGSPVDFSSVQMVWATEDVVEILDSVTLATDPATATSSKQWNITNGASKDDLLLEDQDKFTIVAQPTGALSANDQFNLEIRPSVGAAFGLKRTIPAKVNKVNLLY